MLDRGGRMFQLVSFHLFEDRSAAKITAGQFVVVFLKMRNDLVFGLGEKSQVPPVADRPGKSTDSKRAAVPQRIQQAGMTV